MLRSTPPGQRSSVPAHRTPHAHREKVRVVPCSTPGTAARQGRFSSLAKRQGLRVSSSVVQVCMLWMVAPRNAKRDETAGCGLRGLEPGRDGAGPAKLGRDGQRRQRAALNCAKRRRAVQDYGQCYTRGVRGGVAWTSSVLGKYALYRG
jgi:hypothetical protein